MLKISPPRALPGARVVLSGPAFPMPADGPPHVLVGDKDARVVAASPRAIRFQIPDSAESGTQNVRVSGLGGASGVVDVARRIASDIHAVDSPVFDRDGNLYVTHSGGRDAKPDVPLYRFTPDGKRIALTIELGNPTSLAIGPDGLLYVSSRFEGSVYRLSADDHVERYATELGVATGLAFSPDGDLYVGDRTGTIFRVRPDRQVETFASLPSSVAAFHLAFGPDGCLYACAPTLATHDAVYRITPDRLVDVVTERFGRPQGLAFDPAGNLFVVDALAGASGLFRVDLASPSSAPELVVAAADLVGVAFDSHGGVALASSDTVWKLDGMLTAPLEVS